MVRHIAWAEIENFHTLRKTLLHYPHLLKGGNVVKYRAKVKLHGTNAGVMIESDRTVTAISRSSIITPQSDNAGFARWVDEHKEVWATFAPAKGTCVVFGEWCGPSIQKGVAVNQIPEKVFALFGARVVGDEELEFDFFDQPWALRGFSNHVPKCHVIPWFNGGEEFEVDWSASSVGLEPVLDRINQRVAQVEECDPWVAENFDIKGTGEGLVFYPISDGHRGYESFKNLCFKAKGEKHKVVARTKPAQADPTVAAGLADFASMVITPARFEQGVRAVADGELRYDPKLIGAFLAWISKDVIKETQAELQAAGLEEKAAVRACSDRARDMYVFEMKK